MIHHQQQQGPSKLGSSISQSRGPFLPPQGRRWELASPTRRKRALAAAASDPDAVALLSTKLCLAVAAEEAVPSLCLPSNFLGGVQAGGGGLRFFGLDCRPREQLSTGRCVRSAEELMNHVVVCVD